LPNKKRGGLHSLDIEKRLPPIKLQKKQEQKLILLKHLYQEEPVPPHGFAFYSAIAKLFIQIIRYRPGGKGKRHTGLAPVISGLALT
jgi:hypothetical protein